MRTFIYAALLIVLGFILQSFLPWWIIVLLAGLLGFVGNLGGTRSLLIGFCAVLLLWLGYALWLDTANSSLISSRVSELLFDSPQPWLILLVTGLLGGILGGLGMLTGYYGRNLFAKSDQ